VPEYLPVAKQVIAGSDGTVWLRRTGLYSDGEHDVWTVFDPTGTAVAAVDVPHGVRVPDANRAYAWAAIEDEIGVPYVVRYRVE